MPENVISADNGDKVKTNLENVTKLILNDEFEAKPQKDACYIGTFRSICYYVESD